MLLVYWLLAVAVLAIGAVAASAVGAIAALAIGAIGVLAIGAFGYWCGRWMLLLVRWLCSWCFGCASIDSFYAVQIHLTDKPKELAEQCALWLTLGAYHCATANRSSST